MTDPLDVLQLTLVLAAVAATVALLITCWNEWRDSRGHSRSAYRIAIASVALMLVEFGSLASLGAKLRWWDIEGWPERVTTAGRTAMLTLVIWLAWVKWEEYKAWRTRHTT